MILQNLLNPFKQLLTAPLRVSTLNWTWLPFAISAGASLFKGFSSSQRYDQAAGIYRDASYANAADILHYSGLNSGLMMGAAERNAEALMRIGEANASAVERATERNMKLYRMQADEEVRRHIIGEKIVAGTIRAITGSSGIMTNTGTPLRYLESQVSEGTRQRKFMQEKHAQTLLTMKMEGADRAEIYRLTASENAAVTMANAEAQIGVMMNDAARMASQLQRQGDIGYSQYRSQASGSMWDGIFGAASSIGQGYFSGAFNNLFSGSSAALSAPPTIAQNTPPKLLTAPGYAGAPSSYTGHLPSWFR